MKSCIDSIVPSLLSKEMTLKIANLSSCLLFFLGSDIGFHG